MWRSNVKRKKREEDDVLSCGEKSRTVCDSRVSRHGPFSAAEAAARTAKAAADGEQEQKHLKMN